MIELVVKLGERVIEEARIDKEVLNIGRDPGCDITLDNLGVSRQHAQIRVVQERYLLSDSHSTNGTLLNGRPIQSAEISPGDLIQIGKFDLTFQVVEEKPSWESLDINQTIAMPGLGSVMPVEESRENFAASIARPVFHRPECPWIKATGIDHKIFFGTVEEAISSGRRPCKSCNPTQPATSIPAGHPEANFPSDGLDRY
jgi:pSer/pThr/pTyr-binding forkhead associated (FHA) protein